MKKLSPASRVMIAIASLALIATYFLPVWAIYLIAPQYPEGLEMQIWLNKITGEVDIINGLNHYIGMKKINADMFPEFTYLVYIVGGLIVFGLAVAISGSRKLLTALCVTLLLFAVAALVDFYKWGYDYGHNLDPTAPIQVPGLSYQPPVIGHKKLLNFDAYSYPDTGGWIVVVAGLLFFVILFLEWRKHRKTNSPATVNKSLVAALVLTLFIASCTAKPEKITYGKDSCTECKMTIMDPKFGGEIITKKGKVFKFDDAHCMASYLDRRGVELSEISQTVFVNYKGGENFIDVRSAHFVLSSQLKSPMGSNAAAFDSKDAAEKKAAEIDGKVTDWPTIYNVIK